MDTITKRFEVIGKYYDSNNKLRYSVCAVDTTEVKTIFKIIKPNFKVEIVYPSNFDKIDNVSN